MKIVIAHYNVKYNYFQVNDLSEENKNNSEEILPGSV